MYEPSLTHHLFNFGGNRQRKSTDSNWNYIEPKLKASRFDWILEGTFPIFFNTDKSHVVEPSCVRYTDKCTRNSHQSSEWKRHIYVWNQEHLDSRRYLYLKMNKLDSMTTSAYQLKSFYDHLLRNLVIQGFFYFQCRARWCFTKSSRHKQHTDVRRWMSMISNVRLGSHFSAKSRIWRKLRR